MMSYINQLRMPYSDLKWIEMLQRLFDNITLPIFSILAALGGGIIATRFHEPKTRTEAFIIMLGGFCCAVFMGSMVTDWLRLQDNSAAGVHFITSLIGMYAIEGLITIAKRFSKNPLGTIKDIKSLKDEEKIKK